MRKVSVDRGACLLFVRNDQDAFIGTFLTVTCCTTVSDGRVPSCCQNHTAIALLLDVNGWTPLHEAVMASSEAIVELLVEKGADVNAVTNGGDTALKLAREYKGEDHSMVELLKRLGASMEGEL